MTTGSKPIWRVQATPEQLVERARNTLAERIGIRVTEIGPDYLRATRTPMSRPTPKAMPMDS